MPEDTGPLEQDVVLDDGRTVRVNGLLAVRYREHPDEVRKFLADFLDEKADA
jgi:hypothetical protein